MPSQRKRKRNSKPQVTNSTKWPIVSSDPVIQAFYESCRESGESHSIAEMCAFRQAPSLETDTTFTRGFGTDPFGGPVNSFTHRRYMQMAKAAGVSTQGKRYMSGLARYPGDPKAWVGSKGDVRRVCEKRGWGCEGAVNVKAREKPKTGAKEKRFIKVA